MDRTASLDPERSSDAQSTGHLDDFRSFISDSLSMQNAKDSFYLTMRSRLTTINPERIVLLRGSLRPGILLEDAEAPFAQPPSDVFIVRWLGVGAELQLPSTMIALECEFFYCTSGSQAFGGLDRGRSMTTMDRELLAMLQPLSTPKLNYSVQPPAPLKTRIFWDEPAFAPITALRDRLSRTARVMLYSYEEQSEL